MSHYKLLTPGPLSTSETVKQTMMQDVCTWDTSYKTITQTIREELLQLAEVSSEEYSTVLMQGSGSYVVESVLTSVIPLTGKVLIIVNGAYGERIIEMAEKLGIPYATYRTDVDDIANPATVESLLLRDSAISHIAMVHCETTTGILNPIESIGAVAKQYGKTFIVDAMSSFGGVPIHMTDIDIDYLVSSANKCIEGVPGFGFVICKRAELEKCKGNARSVVLDLHAQWKAMDVEGKWRFTSPTHTVLAFLQALKELKKEGGIQERYRRYKANNDFIREELKKVGIETYIDEVYQSPIISTFLFPNDKFTFEVFYEAMKDEGFIIYPGKLTDVDTFRIGNIGHLFRGDMEQLCQAIQHYMMEVSINEKN